MYLSDGDKEYSRSEALELEKKYNKNFNEYKLKIYKKIDQYKKSIGYKKFVDEILPINYIFKLYNVETVKYCGIKNDSCDGIIKIDGQEIRIECTTAINYEMRSLIQKGLLNNTSISAVNDNELLKKSIG